MHASPHAPEQEANLIATESPEWPLPCKSLSLWTLIGIIAGLAVTRYGRGWFGTRASDLTAALVGIAGAFLGFHVGVAAGLVPVPVADYLLAIVGALVTLWAWRNCANALSDPKSSENANIKADHFPPTPSPAR